MADAQIMVRVHARAGRDEVVGVRVDAVVVHVTAPPVDGRANRAVCRLIADRTGVAPSRVTIARGERSRDKLVRVEGIDPATLRKALGAA